MERNLEIERKFLVSGPYKQDAVSCSHIMQGYICAASGRTVRVRLRDDKAYLTIKGPSGHNGLARFEWEKEISSDDAIALMSLSETPVIDKTRWLVPDEDGVHIWEVDEFHGANDGLIIAEVELRSEDDSFSRPSWLGGEVTGDKRYYNSHLSRNPYCNW